MTPLSVPCLVCGRTLPPDEPHTGGTPRRIRMTREFPWRDLHPGAVICSRGTSRTGRRWSNPFAVGATCPIPGTTGTVHVANRQQAALLFRQHLAPALEAAAAVELAGFDLACWCPLPIGGAPDWCHAAFLLSIVTSKGLPSCLPRR